MLRSIEPPLQDGGSVAQNRDREELWQGPSTSPRVDGNSGIDPLSFLVHSWNRQVGQTSSVGVNNRGLPLRRRQEHPNCVTDFRDRPLIWMAACERLKAVRIRQRK